MCLPVGILGCQCSVCCPCVGSSLSVCLPVSLSGCQYVCVDVSEVRFCLVVCVCLPACQPIWLALFLFVCLCTACLSIGLSLCLSACVTIFVSCCLCICLSVCLPVSLSGWRHHCLSDCELRIFPSVWLSICLYMSLPRWLITKTLPDDLFGYTKSAENPTGTQLPF